MIRGHCFCLHLKLRIGKTVAEGEYRFYAEAVKVAVPHINAFLVFLRLDIAVVVAERGRIGEITVADCPGIRQLSAGIHRSRQHIRQGISALHAGLHQAQQRLHFVKGQDFFHVDLSSHI